MATLRIASKQVSPATSFFLDADIVQTDTANRRWRIRFYLRAMNGPGGSSGSQYNGSGAQIGRINGVEFGRVARTPFLPAGYGDNTTRWSQSWDFWLGPANSSGYWAGTSQSVPLSMQLQYGNINTTLSGSMPVPRIGGPPSKPAKPVLKTRYAQSIAYTISAPANNGSPITTYNHQIARNSAFTSGVENWNSGATNQSRGNLRPNTPYWIRYRAVNAFGTSSWSDALAVTTLATEAPRIAVAPSVDGLAATVTGTPPSGMSGVSSYEIEYRVGTAAATRVSTTTTSTLIEDLVPGLTYSWRISAMIDDYQTPWTAWTDVAQPKPNVNPGDYFDGSTPAKADNTFSWVGAANNSMSRMSAPGVLGWEISQMAPGGNAVLHRLTGGQTQQFSARMVFLASATGAGYIAGIADGNLLGADVAEGGVYRARMAVRPSRAQRGHLGIAWYDINDALLEREPVTDDAVVPGKTWSLLTGIATAPAGAMRATVYFEDVAGTGHSPWLSGENLDMDSAFLTLGADLIDYFDGSTKDTSQFDYAWAGLANRSPSLRRDVNRTPPNPLADPDCPPIPSAPQPPVIANACIEETGSWRRYWAIIPVTEVYEFLAVIPTITVATATTPARQVRLRFYENPDQLAPADADGLPYQAEQIISYMPARSVVTIDGVSETAWATVQGVAGDLPAEELLYGTGGGPATWPVLSCGTAYLISFDVPLDAPIGNIQLGVSLTTRIM
ncbi:minor tail protein [Microbacterium phage Fransoyer]|nr:minor tail protein [Microbacterium phage Fransoyer]